MPPANPRGRNRPGRQHQHLPRFGRSHPFLYRLFLISSHFTTPLTILTIASTSSLLQQKLSSSALAASSSPSSSSSSWGSTWRFPFTPSLSVTESTSASTADAAGSSLSVAAGWAWMRVLRWKKVTLWLWYLSVWSYFSKHALIGASVFWVLSGAVQGEEDELGAGVRAEG